MFLAKSAGGMPRMMNFTAGSDWTKVTIPFSPLGIDASDLQAVMFADVAAPGPFRFLVDDVRFDR